MEQFAQLYWLVFLAHYKIDNLRQEILLTAQRGQGQLAVVGPTERGFRNRLS